MANLLRLMGALAVMLAGSACTTLHDDPVADERLRETLVVVVKDPRSERRRLGLSGPGYQARLAYQDDPSLRRLTSALASEYELSVLTQWPIKTLEVHCFVIERPPADRLAALEQDPRVRWVQPFNEYEMKSSPAVSVSNAPSTLANRFIETFDARGEGVRVVVVDTSADQEHPGLSRARLHHQNFAGSRGALGAEPHGTAVVGLIAAAPGEMQDGVRGIAPDAEVHLLRGCWQESQRSGGRCNTLTLALALDAAVAVEPDIVNLSLSGPADRVLDELTRKLLDQGSIIVSAFDEQRSPERRFPMPRDGVVYAYGLSDEQPRPDSERVLFAPRHAFSLIPEGGYDLVSGHSIASPQLAGMAAVLIEQFPEANRADILDSLDRWLSQHYDGRQH